MLAGIALRRLLRRPDGPRREPLSPVRRKWVRGVLDLGSFAGVVGRDVVVAAVIVIPAIRSSWRAWPSTPDALALGESAAGHLGIDVPRLAAATSIIFALLAAVAVAVAGVIAFVALMVPSLVRAWVGRSTSPRGHQGALLGATLLVIADVLARSLFSPVELSVGVITTVVGARLPVAAVPRYEGAAGQWMRYAASGITVRIGSATSRRRLDHGGPAG